MTKKTILVIDDNPRFDDFQHALIRNKMDREFSLQDDQVWRLENVSTAADDPSIVAVVTDNDMHGTACALEICKLLRSKPHLANVPIYVQSTFVSKSHEDQIRAMGIEIHGKMPHETEDILQDIKTRVRPTHLPNDHKPPATPGEGEIIR